MTRRRKRVHPIVRDVARALPPLMRLIVRALLVVTSRTDDEIREALSIKRPRNTG